MRMEPVRATHDCHCVVGHKYTSLACIGEISSIDSSGRQDNCLYLNRHKLYRTILSDVWMIPQYGAGRGTPTSEIDVLSAGNRGHIREPRSHFDPLLALIRHMVEHSESGVVL